MSAEGTARTPATALNDRPERNVPFYSPNRKTLHKKILTEKAVLPNWLSPSSHSLVKGLLEKNVERRLGSGNGSVWFARHFSDGAPRLTVRH